MAVDGLAAAEMGTYGLGFAFAVVSCVGPVTRSRGPVHMGSGAVLQTRKAGSGPCGPHTRGATLASHC